MKYHLTIAISLISISISSYNIYHVSKINSNYERAQAGYHHIIQNHRLINVK